MKAIKENCNIQKAYSRGNGSSFTQYHLQFLQFNAVMNFATILNQNMQHILYKMVNF